MKVRIACRVIGVWRNDHMFSKIKIRNGCVASVFDNAISNISRMFEVT